MSRRTIEDVRAVALDDQAGQPPFTTGELGGILGLSPAFIRRECASGAIPARTPTSPGWFRVGRGTCRDYRIQFEAARACLVDLGLVAKGTSTTRPTTTTDTTANKNIDRRRRVAEDGPQPSRPERSLSGTSDAPRRDPNATSLEPAVPAGRCSWRI